MKHASYRCLSILALCVCLLAVSGSAQEKKPETPSPAAMQEMMKKWKEAMTPGDAHKHLNFLVGSWTFESKAWMNGPEAPPEVSKGTSTMKPILGGRFILQEMKSTMMGMPMDGIGYLGYDNFKKTYVGLWLDNTSTAIYTMEGSANADHTVFTLEGKSDEPATGEKDKPMQYVWRVIDKKTHVFEIHDLSLKNGNTKVMEMTYHKR